MMGDYLLDKAEENDPLPMPDDGRQTFLERHSTLILCLALFLLPLIGMGAVKSLNVYASDIRQWLPSGFEEAKTYDWFLEKFGIDEMVVASWPGATLDDLRVTAMREALEEQTYEFVDPDSGELNTLPMFSRVTSGPDMIQEFAGVTEKVAKDRLNGLMIGPDGKTTCVIAYPNKPLLSERRQILFRIQDVALREFGLSADDLKLGGPTIDGAAIDIESKRSLNRYLWMSIFVVFLLTWFRLRDLPLTLMTIFCAVLCTAIALSVLHFAGGQMNLTMIMLPTLVFILAVSGSIHVVNYYRKAVTLGYGIHAADQAMKDGRYPIALSAITTAVGLFSLSVSRVAPIRSFGFFSGCGVLASLVVILLVLPAALYLLKGRISKWFSPTGRMEKRERTSGVSRGTSVVINWVCREHGLVVIPVLIGVSILSVGVLNLQASVKIQNRFSSRAKILQDYEWLEENLGPLVPMEVVLDFGPENGLPLWQRMQVVKSVERSIRKTTAVNATLSVGTFEPTMPRGTRFRDKVERRAILDKWTGEFESFQEANLVNTDGDHSFWRISLRVAALNDIDYGDFLEAVQKNVQHQLDHLKQPGVRAILTGGIPLVYKAQHQILSDLLISFLTAFIFISLILIFVLRSVRSGLVAMVPNIFPPLVIFGAMGWMGRKIEIGSVMTASVALGIAVDDTIHFLTWYRRGTVNGLSRFKSIRFAFEHCAKAMIDTSLICGLGVAPFLLGVFMPTINFAALLMIMLFTALLGDLILLPALLAGPAGVLFRLRKVVKIPTGSSVESEDSAVVNAKTK